MPLYLGIDPGLATIGFGLIEKKGSALKIVDFGVIKTPPTATLGNRLKMIGDDFDDLLKTHKPDFAGMEELFFVKNVTNGIKVAQARGVLMERLAQAKIPLLELTPLQVKSGLTGDGKADKIQVQTMLKKIFKLSHLPKPDDAADALAIAYCASLQFR
jgi:crossover junction endodeoxyribonuclease RuvC